MSRLASALDELRACASPEELTELAAGEAPPSATPTANAHVHLPPNYSAFESVAQAVELAAAQGVQVLGASNYFDFHVYGELVEAARSRGVFPLFGVELLCMDEALRDDGVLVNDPGNPGKIYLCGKGLARLEPMSDEARRLVTRVRDDNARRMEEMTTRLDAIFTAGGVATELDASRIVEGIVARHACPAAEVHLQERHLCRAFQERLFDLLSPAERGERLAAVLGVSELAVDPTDAVLVQGEVRARLMKAGRPAFVSERFLGFDEACRLILELGGIPCYPTLADGAGAISPFEATPATLVEHLREREIHAAELIPVRNDPQVMASYVRELRAAGLVVTAGTEHNTLDLIALEPTCCGAPLPDDVRAILWEGTCVVAAHQHLVLHGRPGFVDGGGRPDSEHADAEARIAAFARLGTALIRRYRESCATGGE